jgi:osomolarity two-component system response regulator SKN7
MPKLDGVSATSMIRKFDLQTPIISMTSSSRPTEIMTYYSSGPSVRLLFLCCRLCGAGMNDILPKPFTKDGLLEVLEVRNGQCPFDTDIMNTSRNTWRT